MFLLAQSLLFPSLQVLYIQAFVLVFLLGKFMGKVFFGQLRAAEMEVSEASGPCNWLLAAQSYVGWRRYTVAEGCSENCIDFKLNEILMLSIKSYLSLVLAWPLLPECLSVCLECIYPPNVPVRQGTAVTPFYRTMVQSSIPKCSEILRGKGVECKRKCFPLEIGTYK